jgi:hypothetical protein
MRQLAHRPEAAMRIIIRLLVALSVMYPLVRPSHAQPLSELVQEAFTTIAGR